MNFTEHNRRFTSLIADLLAVTLVTQWRSLGLGSEGCGGILPHFRLRHPLVPRTYAVLGCQFQDILLDS